MHLSRTEFEALDAETLAVFVDRCLPEDHYLDYKRFVGGNAAKEGRTDPAPSDGEKKEFAKDLSGFANASGGLLLIGYDEPCADGSTPAMFHGVADGSALQRTLENVAATRCDRRLPGLLMKSIAVEPARYAVVCFVPPSASKPHAVDARFHRRASESTLPMKADEVKQSVLDAYTRQNAIQSALAANESELVRYWLQDSRAAGFVLQAIPSLEPDPLWDVQTEPFMQALRGNNRHAETGEYCLTSSRAPYVGLQCLQGDDQRETPLNRWHLEVHVNGLICAVAPNDVWEEKGCPVLVPHQVDLFHAFGRLVDQCVAAAGEQGREMILKATYRYADSTPFFTGSRRTVTTPREHIFFPPLVTNAGRTATATIEPYADMLFNAYGVVVAPEQRQRFAWARHPA